MNRSSVSARQAVRTAGDVAQRFAGDIENARQNRAGIDQRNGPGTRLTYAGQNAETADVATLDEARQRIADGEDSETVRKETGWFRGMDGKWRFEIDDSKIGITLPSSTFSRLSDIVDHPALFEAYPDLQAVEVFLERMYDGERAKYNPQFDSISINRDIVSNEEQLRASLAHEIQHAIQNREGFTPGSSPQYWERATKEGQDTRTIEERKNAQELRRQYDEWADRSPEFVREMEALDRTTPDVPRGSVLNWDTLESEPDPPEWISYDERRESLEKKYGLKDVWDFIDLQYKLQEAEKRSGKLTPRGLYYQTAGEIEARDTARRQTMTLEQRKNTRPDIDRKDVVFARPGTKSFDMANAPQKRSYIPYKDRAASDKIEKETAMSLIAKGKVTEISLADYSDLKKGVDWSDDKKDGKEAVKDILKPFIGQDLYFRDGSSTVVAYLTRKGVNHSGAGGRSLIKGALYSKFLELVSKAEYAYSTQHDPHAKQNPNLTPIAWDSYVATAYVEVKQEDGTITKERYDVVFKLESVAEDVRSRLNAMWTKKEAAVSHDIDTSEESDSALPNYEATTTSVSNIAEYDSDVKTEDQGIDWNV